MIRLGFLGCMVWMVILVLCFVRFRMWVDVFSVMEMLGCFVCSCVIDGIMNLIVSVLVVVIFILLVSCWLILCVSCISLCVCCFIVLVVCSVSLLIGVGR